MLDIMNRCPADTASRVDDSFSVIAVCKLQQQLEASDDTFQPARQFTTSLLSWLVIGIPAVTCCRDRKPAQNACNKQCDKHDTYDTDWFFFIYWCGIGDKLKTYWKEELKNEVVLRGYWRHEADDRFGTGLMRGLTTLLPKYPGTFSGHSPG